MKKKIILSILSVVALSSCAGLTNGVKEFGNARFCGDYFLKDYTNFFFYNEKDYARVGLVSSEVKTGEYVSALNGKDGYSYKFFEFANYEQKEYLVVNFVNKTKKINKTYLYASKDSKSVMTSFLEIDRSENNKIVINNTNYIKFGDTFQPVSDMKGNEVGKIDNISFYSLENYSGWVYKENDAQYKTLYFKEDIDILDINLIWLVADNVVHE